MAGILDTDAYPIAEINQALKMKIGYGFMVGLDQLLGTKLGKSIRSAAFDKAKFTKEAAEKWVKDRGIGISDITEDEKSFYVGLRKFSDFMESDAFDRVPVAEGIDLLIKTMKPEILQIVKLEQELLAEFGKMIRHEDGKFCVYSHDGSKNLGCHPTKDAAMAHLAAIEMNKATFTEEEIRAAGKAAMEKAIKQEGDKFCLYDAEGKKLGEYPTMEAAKEAMMANMNKSDSKLTVTKNEGGNADFNISFPIEKLNEEEQIVVGIVYEPDKVDLQGDYATESEIYKATNRFNIERGSLGIMHKDEAGDRAQILQSYTMPVDGKVGNRYVKKGSWVMVIKVADKALWADVKSGKITGLSMAGSARAA